jgi:hypothetical protein
MAEDTTSYPIHENNGTWEIGAGVPGPAGAASLDLGDDVTLTVDVAEPSFLIGLTGPDERSITIADAGLLDRLGRLAVLEDAAREQALWGDPSGWWDAEAVLLRAQAPPGLTSADGLDDRARRGAAAVLAVDIDGLEPTVGDRVRAVAAALAATLESLDGDAAARLRAVARTVRKAGPSLTDDTVEAAFGGLIAQAFAVALEPGVVEEALVTRGAPGTAHERQVGLDPAQLPSGLAAAGPLRLVVGADNRSATARLTIPPAIAAPQLWLTVSRRADGVLLAVLPMRPVDGGTTLEATITLHAPDDLDTVHLDATVEPILAPPSSARRAMRAATSRGRVAARAMRLGQNDEAALLWLACSQRWADAGDPEREAVAHAWAALALERAELAADADQLRRDAPPGNEPWAQERARRLPVAGAPFLAELMPSPERGART